jgi:hypothetical protein
MDGVLARVALSISLAVGVLPGGTASADQTSGKQLTTSFNSGWLDTVASIEIQDANQKRQSIGTGFLVETPNKHVALVTAKHVIARAFPTGARLVYRLTTQEGIPLELWEDELSKIAGGWVQSSLDLALRLLPSPKGTKITPLTAAHFIPQDTLTAGAPLFILGFPLGLRTDDQPKPITRRGIVGRVDQENIIADAFVFPGGSGAPVIYSPLVRLGNGLQSGILNEDKLIGIVSSFIAYADTAFSLQTQRPRVVFEENTGLANVVPVAKLIELLNSETFRSLDAKGQ